MSFYRDRQIRGYCFFLTAFVIVTLGVAPLFCIYQSASVKRMYLAHNAAIASSLLKQGVSMEVIADALVNTSIHEAGEKLLHMIGIEEETAGGMLPFLSQFQQETVCMAMITALLLAWSLLVGTFVFLEKRRRLYLQADGTMNGYINGDFSGHLPQSSEGALFQVFARIEQLAMALQSKNESEHRTKEFLKSAISDISHQLKTPLAALAMYQEIIEGEPDNVAAVKQFSAKTGAALKRMERLIQSMLKIARLDTGNIVFQRDSYHVSEVVLYAVAELTARAGAEGKELLIDGDPAGRLVCDMEWTGEAIGNIVKNALDHTRKGGIIRITWEHTPAMVRIFVSDNGNGIAPEDIYHIFKRFYRSKHSLDTQGIGLGLPLAKSIIEGQGGSISVQSDLHEGTTFILSFLTEL